MHSLTAHAHIRQSRHLVTRYQPISVNHRRCCPLAISTKSQSSPHSTVPAAAEYNPPEPGSAKARPWTMQPCQHASLPAQYWRSIKQVTIIHRLLHQMLAVSNCANPTVFQHPQLVPPAALLLPHMTALIKFCCTPICLQQSERHLHLNLTANPLWFLHLFLLYYTLTTALQKMLHATM